MKLAIIAVVVLLLLGGGGAFLYFQGDKQTSKSDGADETSESVSAFDLAPVLFEINALAVPVIRNRRVERYVLLQIKLELVDEDARKETSRLSAKLHDAFINSLFDYYSYVTPGPKGVNVSAVRKRLMRESKRILGKGLVRKILVKGLVQKKSEQK